VADDGRAVFTAWRRLLQAVRRRERLAERDVGLTGAQLFALRQLESHPGATIGQLATLTVTDASSTSVVVARLLEKGCVRRERDPDDQRRWRLHPTREGADRLARAPDSADQRLAIALVAITPAARAELAAHLNHLARAVEPLPT
jgi:DNA-binding MarR family transcriptional regulator